MNSSTQMAKPTYEIDLGEKIISFASSSAQIHGESILLIAFKRKILILALDLNAEEFSLDYKTINEIAEPETRILKICSQVIARDILLCAASNYNLKVFTANESEVICMKQIDAHTNLINSVDFSEDFLASGSDDHTCKIYSVKENYSEHSTLFFSASVTCVKFNPEETNKLLISIKDGNLFIYCLKLKQSLYSFYTQSPLMNFDWSIKNPKFVAAIAFDQVFYFDISKPE